MDGGSNLQAFEESLSEYTGDDPLDPWDRYIQCLQKMLSSGESREMSVVLDRLVQRFLPDERYCNDIRYINYCIKCASYYKEPISLYSHIYSKGIGTRAAVLYVAWAQQFEQQGQLQQADMVYRRAMENQAEPSDTVLQQYRMFRTRTSSSGAWASGVGNPLQSSRFVNQLHSHREAGPLCKDTDDLAQLPADKTIRIISRSENAVVKKPSHGSKSLQTVSMYCKDDLFCEGSELCFEEVRAARFFVKRNEEEKQRVFGELQRLAGEQEKEMMGMKQLLEQLESNLGGSASCQERLAGALPVQHTPCPPETGVNSEFLRQSFRDPALSKDLAARPDAGLGRNGGRDPRQSTAMVPETHLPCERLRGPVAGALSSRRSSPPPEHLRGEIASRGFSLHMPDAAVGNFHGHTEGTTPSAPWASSLQASLVPPQPDQHPRSFGLAAQKPAAYGPEELQPSGVPHQGGVFQISNLLHQHQGRGHHVTSVDEALETEVKLDLSQGGTGNLSHMTPNTSSGLAQATPSRVLPSPTVNTREALDTIMDMFQAPNLLQEDHCPSIMSMHQTERSFDAGYQAAGDPCLLRSPIGAVPPGAVPPGAVPPGAVPPVGVPFAVFQDEQDDKENCSAAAVTQAKPPRALVEIPVSRIHKQNESRSELMPDESTMWGVRYDSLSSVAACPNSTRDFALLAQLVSTPFQKKAPYSWDCEQDQENGHHLGCGAPEEGPFLRQPTKLSPIIEQSPPDGLSETGTEGSMRAQGFAEQGTIVGEGLAQRSLAACSITEVQHHAPTALSFRDQTASLVHTEGAVATSPPSKSSKPDWDVYVSPEKPLKPDWDVYVSPEKPLKPDWDVYVSPEKPLKPDWDVYVSPEKPVLQSAFPLSHCAPVARSQIHGLDVPTSPLRAPTSTFDTPMSPELAPLSDWLLFKSPEVVVEPDLDLEAFMSPRQGRGRDASPPKIMDIPMSPEPPKFGLDVDMSPVGSPLLLRDLPQSPAALNGRCNREIPMTPDHGSKLNLDVPMSPAAQGAVAAEPVSNPWDEDLISSLLSMLPTPLASRPDVITWECKVPNIAPKMTVRMGEGSLRVDCVLGQGAFATVYQATDLTTSEKMILKVQKPANPWEFYINTQLNVRMPPNARHLFNKIHSAHLFQNGSVLLGELHNCGTLLNAVNLYKNTGDKVMPQPLVVYFAVCILRMVEQLHSIRVIHADIKPDNFLLGERFLENKSFDPDHLDHGLALIDLGQSIDMTLFPEGTVFTAKCLTSGFQCTEMQSGRPWTYQTDYFGIAATVYCMMFGTYMQVTREDGVWKTNAVFRRNPLSEVWTEFFHTLLNVPDCRSLPCLRSLRGRLSAALQQHYGSKLSSLKTRLVVQLLESRSARR